MSLSLKIGGVDKTAFWFLPGERDEVDATVMAGERGTISVVLYDLVGVGGYRAAIDDTLELLEGATVRFSATIDDVIEESFAQELDRGIRLSLTATDHHGYLERLEYAGSFNAGTSTRVIVEDILAVSGLAAAPFNVTLDAGDMGTGAPNGLMMTSTTTFDGTVKEAFDKLKQLTRYIYRIDAADVLVFHEPGFVSCGYSLTDADTAIDGVVGSISIQQSRQGTYYNRVRVTAGPAGAGEPLAHVWSGNGVATVFNLFEQNVPASNVWPGVVMIDAVAYPLHAPGTAPGGNGIEWDYGLNHGTLSFLGTSAAVATAMTTATLTFTPLYPFTITVVDAGEVAARGPYVSPRVLVPEVLVYAEAVAIGQAIVRQRITTPKIVTVSTGKGIAYPGQSIVLTFAEHAIDDTFLITAVQMRTIEEDALEYTLTCVEGSEVAETFLDFYGGSSGGSAGTTIVAGGGGGSTTVLTAPILLGGARNAFVAADPLAWAPVPNWVPFVCATSTSLRLRAYAAAREATFGVEVRLYDMTAAAAVAGSTSGVITSTTFTEWTATVAILAGHTYRLEVRNSSNGRGVSAIGVLEGL